MMCFELEGFFSSLLLAMFFCFVLSSKSAFCCISLPGHGELLREEHLCFVQSERSSCNSSSGSFISDTEHAAP